MNIYSLQLDVTFRDKKKHYERANIWRNAVGTALVKPICLYLRINIVMPESLPCPIINIQYTVCPGSSDPT